MDFGRSATIPVQSLRTLDSDDFWTIPPLTQPFMLEKGKAPSTLLQRTQGTVDAVRSSGRLCGNGFCVGAAKARRIQSLPFSLYSFGLTLVFSICPLLSFLENLVFIPGLSEQQDLEGDLRCCLKAEFSGWGEGKAGLPLLLLPELLSFHLFHVHCVLLEISSEKDSL